MEYVLTDRDSTGMDAYWFARSIPTLELAKIEAQKYPEALYIIEYKSDFKSKGILPTGKSWEISQILAGGGEGK